MPETPYEALVLALTLALTAPSDTQADECADMAEQIASAGNLTTKQIEDAQVEAAAAAELWNSSQ
jgi:hypothetical protein